MVAVAVPIVENAIAIVVSKLHKTWSSIGSTWAVGLTVIVKVWVSPWLLIPPFSNVGVTVKVATTAEFPLLTALKVGKSPDPDTAKPIDSVLFVHSNVVLPTEFALWKFIRTSSPLQITSSSTLNIDTTGLIVIVYSSITAAQSTPSRIGVII